MIPEIIYEDNHIIAVNKKRGIPTQQDITGVLSMLDYTKDYIRLKYSKPGNIFLGMVQRLDRPVSGVLVFARTSKAASRLSEQFLKHTVRKFYIAVVENEINEDEDDWKVLKNSILKRKGFSEIVKDEHPYSKKAELHFRVIKKNEKNTVILIELITGRKHQIRAQLSNAGFPIIGDKKYGAVKTFKNDKIMLHACFLRIVHPTLKQNIDLKAQIPDDLMEYLNSTNNINSFIEMKINE